MSLPLWPHAVPPFHAGEQAVQQRAGSRERMAEIGRRVVRAELIDQHREFFALLPFIVVGAADRDGRPWATLLAGEAAGFVTSPDETRLDVRALPPPDDPVAPCLQAGAPLGLLGIELATRRRNRANGRIVSMDERGFSLQVMQSFGNCPKYIQRRESLERGPARPGKALRLRRLDERAASVVRGADTFFVATHAASGPANGGSDVSHRGGRPGFVRLEDDARTLTWPDFAGNRFFNTLGNIALDGRAGLVFADFVNGDLLHVTGRAEVIWDGPALEGFAGAERLVRLRIDEAVLRPQAWPLRWRLVETSPFLDATGTW
jgi:hypothetical protein